MLDIKKLENRWKIYKIKSLIPYIIVLILIFILFITAYNYLLASKNIIVEKKNIVKKQIEITPVVITKAKKTEIIKPLEKEIAGYPLGVKEEVVKKLVLTPSFDFIENLQNRVIVKKEKKNHSIKKTTAPKVVKQDVKKILPITIKRRTSYKDIDDVIKRFKKNQNPALSLFVAKKYYELGEYNKSYDYALITNNLNSEIETSWIIFAKSLVKLDKKTKAIKMLVNYVNHSNSSRAKNLLDDINKGVFK